MTLINGPINIVRLKGEVNNVHKIVYFYFDIHLDIKKQTKCNYEKKSIDVDKYLEHVFKNTKKPLDFFMEIRNEQFEKLSKMKKIKNLFSFNERYIFQMIKLFNKYFLDKEKKTKKYKISLYRYTRLSKFIYGISIKLC